MAAAYGLDWFGVGSLPWIAGALMLLVLGASLRIREAPHAESHAGGAGLVAACCASRR